MPQKFLNSGGMRNNYIVLQSPKVQVSALSYSPSQEYVIQLDENFILKTRTLAIKTYIFVKITTKNTSKSKSGGAKNVDMDKNNAYCYLQ